MELTYYGHSCFSVRIKGHVVLFDPFVTGNPMAKHIDVDGIAADHIFVTHGHADHILDCARIAGRTGAQIVCNWEIHEWFQRQGITNTHPMNTGGKHTFGFGMVKAVVAHHSSGLPDGTYGGNPMGFVVRSEEGNFYYSGDTGITLDMQLIPSFVPPDFALLPIGDNFTMGHEDAARAAHMIQCRKIIGLHYDTFEPIRIDKEQSLAYFERQGIELILPEIGSTIKI
jgi:L-ascorbate metabolism protein UlaG (beta-lactamase superfamily)